MKNSRETLRRKVEELEKSEMLQALEACNWVQARAARSLGITVRMAGYSIRKYGLEREPSGQARGVEDGSVVDGHAAPTYKKEET